MASTTSKITIDHGEIRRWAEERGANPAIAIGIRDNESGGVCLHLPGSNGHGSLREIGWKDWFKRFDQGKLALLYQEHTAGGEKSDFNQIVSRKTAEEVSDAVGGKGRSVPPIRASKQERALGARSSKPARSAALKPAAKKSASARARTRL